MVGISTPQPQEDNVYYKHFYELDSVGALWRVLEKTFHPINLLSNETHKDASWFVLGKGMHVLAATEALKRWNKLYVDGSTRYYAVRSNAQMQADKLNSGKTGKSLVPIVPMPKATPMQNGEIKKLPRGNAPAFSDQWAVQGIAKAPYIVTQKLAILMRWQCSCPNWTQHTPRIDCKHIVAVKQKEGILVEKTSALLSADQQKLFEAFLKQQAEAGTPALKVEAKPLNLFAKTGRRFR